MHCLFDETHEIHDVRNEERKACVIIKLLASRIKHSNKSIVLAILLPHTLSYAFQSEGKPSA